MIHFLCLLVQGYNGLVLCYGVFISEEVDEVGVKVSGDTTAVDAQTLLETFMNMSLRSACSIDDAFFW